MAVVRVSLERWIDPAAAWGALLTHQENSFWLDSGPDASAGFSYLGAGSTISTKVPHIPLVDGQSGFTLGWVGWIGYEYRGVAMGEPIPAPADVALMWAEWALAFDHTAGTVTVLVHSAQQVAGIVAALEGAMVPGGSAVASGASVSWAYSDYEYLAMIRACQAAISEGDAYQLCLTSEATVLGSFDPISVYLALRESSPAHHGGLIRVGSTALLSTSPEQFLSVSPSGEVSSSPIKGTRPRSADPIVDALMAAELLASEKERAENLMIVDLMRNDLGRVSVVGTVSVPSLLQVESYEHVHQLVSTVTGQLMPGLTGADVVAATFPAGSMTGAPKRAAVRLLNAFERRPRGIYAGVFGYFSLDGSLDLAMVIRSIVLRPGIATVGAGGGITALSVPEEELEEIRVKAAPLLRVLGGTASPSEP